MQSQYKFICIFLMTEDVERFFLYLFLICCCLERICSVNFPMYWFHVCSFLCLIFMFLIYSAWKSSFRWNGCNDFCHSVGFLHIGNYLFCCHNLLNVMWSHLSILASLFSESLEFYIGKLSYALSWHVSVCFP
jgi:hypothetical protein